MALNNVTLMGRFVADPELTKTNSDIAVCNFTLAVDKPRSNNNENSQANFIDCVAWRGSAESICKYFNKGNRIAITGHLQTRTYKDRSDTSRKVTEVVVDTFTFVDSKNKSETSPSNTPNNNQNIQDEDDPFEEEELPY